MNTNSHPLISLIIVCWNSGRYLQSCLNSISVQQFRDFEIILIDNGSQDGSTIGLEEKYPDLEVRVERLKQNLGFAAGNNLGAHLARGKWLVLLNADAFPEPNWLEELLNASRKYTQITSFSSRQLQMNDPKILDGAGDAYHVSGMAWRIGLGYPAERYGLETSEIFSPCAAAAMYLRQAFLDVGGFDEDFFSYFEDVDLGFRLQLKGYRCLYIPSAVVYHVGSATFGERSDFAFYHTHRNLIWTFIKNMPSSMLWYYFPAHLALNIVYVIYYSLHGRGRILLKAKWDAMRKLPKIIAKRQKILRSARAKPVDLQSVIEHGWITPYLVGYRLRQAWSKVSSTSS